MGLLGNVAEVKTLRHRLMTPEFVQVFTDLLESSSDGIEVQSIFCYILFINDRKCYVLGELQCSWRISAYSIGWC